MGRSEIQGGGRGGWALDTPLYRCNTERRYLPPALVPVESIP
jgi:hypothetical protein